MKKNLLIVLWLAQYGLFAQADKTSPPGYEQIEFRATARPDRILLSMQGDAARSFTVTWRTDSTVQNATLEWARADASPFFVDYTTRVPASVTALRTKIGTVLYHKVSIDTLKPSTLYAYRVGDGRYWSEWFHYRTAAAKPEPFSFVYLGDAQTKIYSLWSRAIRGAYQYAPNARFVIHAGDLINTANNDYEWAEWFAAGSFIHATIPSVVTPGNHEYESNGSGKKISMFWNPQFNMPNNGPEGLEDQTYYFDYQNVRVISLNSNEQIERQREWVESILKENPNAWTVITFHHPVFSAARGRSNDPLIKEWKPVFDKYNVDLVLQGHDHTYARGQNIEQGKNVRDGETGPVYVVSVSGPKMYPITSARWMKRAAENTQVFQVISIDKNKLTYKAIQVTGEVYDAFELIKKKGKPNKLIEIKPEVMQERTMKNTLNEKKKE